MDITKATRNPTKVHADLKAVGNTTVTKGGCWIIFPADYTAKSLAFITGEVTVLGCWCITTDGKTYGVSSATAMMRMIPDDIQLVEINGEDFYQLRFEPGSVVIQNRFLPCDKKIVYNVMSYFYDYGKAPFYMNVIDHAELLSETKRWNDLAVFKDQITHDIYSAQLQRSLKDTGSFYRHTIKSPADLLKSAQYIPLRDGPANKTSRLAKIADTELHRGIRSALQDDPIRPEPLEQLYMR
tara:strand:- start:4686 stop:5405 length:720 start_codon:yes stop_codon:yes gene_type:complete